MHVMTLRWKAFVCNLGVRSINLSLYHYHYYYRVDMDKFAETFKQKQTILIITHYTGDHIKKEFMLNANQFHMFVFVWVVNV